MARFKDEVVWVTGASSGIGEAVALAFARRGARVVLSARRKEELERVAAACAPSPVLVLPLDLTRPDSFDAATAAVMARFGRIDVMVHNGGISQRSRVRDTQMEVHRRVMEVNYFGYVGLTRAVLPHMQSARSGQFVVISSVMGKIGTPMRSAYAASKHALHGFFDCLRAEVADDGVGVTVICPGYIRTQITMNALTAEGEKLGEMGQDIAAGLPADQAAAQILDAVEARASEAFVGKFGKERLSLVLQRVAPRLLERLVRREPPK